MSCRPDRRHSINAACPQLLLRLLVVIAAAGIQTPSAFSLSTGGRIHLQSPQRQVFSELSRGQWLGRLLSDTKLPTALSDDPPCNESFAMSEDNSTMSQDNATMSQENAIMITSTANLTTVADNSSEIGNESSTAESSSSPMDDEDDDGDDEPVSSMALDAISLLSMANMTTFNGSAIMPFNASDTSNDSRSQLPFHNSSSSPPSPSSEHTTATRQLTHSIDLTSAASSTVSANQLTKAAHNGLADTATEAAISAGGSLRRTATSNDAHGFVPSLLSIALIVLITASVILAGVACFDYAAAQTSASESTDASAQLRQWVRSLPVMTGDELQQLFPGHGGYDCLHVQPKAPAGAVRLEGRVVASSHNVLKAPLARRSCVLFSTSASTVRLDGVRAPPTAFYAMNSDFELELQGEHSSRGSAQAHIRIRGRDAALFDVTSGWRLERTVLADAPEHLQDFLHAHRAPGVDIPDTTEVLDFTECSLAVGARVTCVGELRREPTGELCLWPLQSNVASPSTTGHIREGVYGGMSGLTSWERTGCAPEQTSQSPRGSPAKVMITDDPALLMQPPSNMCSRLILSLASIFQGTHRASSEAAPESR